MSCQRVSDVTRQFNNRLSLGQVVIPHLFKPRRIATADLLPEREPGDVAPGRVQGLTGFDDGFRGKFGWTHGTLLDLMPSV